MYPGTHAQNQPDKPAIIHPSSGATTTYLELDQRSNQLAQLLYDVGLRPGDHVALFLENVPAFLEITWACLRSGLYLTPINHHLSATEAAYIVDNCDARVLLASALLEQSAELGTLSARCDVRLSVGGGLAGFSEYESAIAGKPTQTITSEQQGTLMLYSSGTTGRPKGILRPLPDGPPAQGNPAMSFVASLFGIDASSIYLTPAPMYHAAPLGYSNTTIQSGGTVVIMEKFEPQLALELIERYHVTHSQWVPTMFIRMLKLPEEIRNRYDLSSHRCAIHAAAPCPIEVKRRMIKWWGPIIEEYYSSTEAAGYAKITSKEWLDHPGSVGRAQGKSFHICDEEGNELPRGQPGLIFGEVDKGAEVKYYKDSEKTASALHPKHDDWLCVGDVGYLDEDDYLYLTDRKAFMIISGGVNIYPQQIEDALALHPKLADVAVIGVPSEELGEEVKAVIQLAPDIEGSDALAEEIKLFISDKLGKQLTPRSIDFVTELPRMPTGKLNKKILRDKYWSSYKHS